MKQTGALSDRITRHLTTTAPYPQRASDIGRALSIPKSERQTLRRHLRQLVADGRIIRLRGGRYAAPGRVRLFTGVLRTVRRGHGFVASQDEEEDLYIPSGRLESALDGDRVVARIEGRDRSGRAEGRILRILERGRSTVVGRFVPGETRAGSVGFVVPDDPAIRRDVIVPVSAGTGANEGDIVVVRVTDWGDAKRGMIGEIDEVLGAADAPGVDVLSLIRANELRVGFPADVMGRAERLRERGIRPADVRDREDLRDRHVFTIDPPDAKDHDDALTVRVRDEGGWEVGVHIADVSFYVRPGSVLDREARLRATSVYLVDRTIPMLPEPLSSELCSLVPGEDRLAMSVFLEIGARGEIRSSRLAQTVIRSRHRLSYGQVQSVFDGESTIDPPTDSALAELRTASRLLRERRLKRGSLDFDLPETRVFLDDEGAPVDIQRAERWESHRLVEDFMIAANEAIGGVAQEAGHPFIYRIHERPDRERIEQLVTFAAALGMSVSFRGVPTPGQLQALLAQRPGSPATQLLTNLALRSMKQARYDVTDPGHFGLAARHYTHFTSPIRRYPDLLVHRIVAARRLGRGRSDRYDTERLASLARLSSERERAAASAERGSVLLKKVRFMERHVGSTFEGAISDVRPFGFFVLLDPYFVEGLVHVSSLADDYYEWVEERFLLKGERTRRRFQVGQRVRVQVSRVDAAERRIEFVLAGEGARKKQPGRRRGRR